MKHTKSIHKKRHSATEIRLNIAAGICAGIALFSMLACKAEDTKHAETAQEPSPAFVSLEPMYPADTFRNIKTRLVEPQEAPRKADALTYCEEIPLDAYIQDHIFTMCEQRGIDPAIVFAIIQRESQYQADVIGDNGKAVGLMQVQARYHADRMARLGCDNLSNPLQNVTVGIDFLDEMLDRGNGVEWAVTAYNRGATGANRCGGKSEYANDVLTEAERIRANVC